VPPWLLAHWASLQSGLVIVVFAAVALWESFRPRRAPTTTTPRRWFTNIALFGIGGALARLCLPLAGVSFALWIAERGFGLLNASPVPAWLAFIVALLALDLVQYGMHRLLHAAPVLWRLHKVHHADLDVDCLTAIRHHPLEGLLVGAADLITIGVLGAPAMAVLAISILSGATSIFNHGNVALPRRIDRALRRAIVTPDMHRIHHSVQDDACNANFSMVFPWWDRWFGTCCEATPRVHEQMRFGIAEAPAAGDVALVNSLLLPFRRDCVALVA
jgi:sterol desaturase/sphingolipid hydroxylase (fatty acid hydroxylase superfamily)